MPFTRKLKEQIEKKEGNLRAEAGFSLFRYLNSEGKFDYQKYVASQIEANSRKIDCVWVQEENIEFLSAYIKAHISRPRLGLCHGTRRGLEQKWFKKYIGCTVIGTEISDTATEFRNIIQWDFHNVKPEWIGAVDFIYSNSLDHSYDPQKCLHAWVSCLNDHGMILLEHTSAHEQSTESDPFGAPLCMMPFLILDWVRDASVREILPAPRRSTFLGAEMETSFLVVRKNL